MKLVRYGVNGLATVALAYLLSRWVVNLPYEFPPLPGGIEFVMRELGVDLARHADDVEPIGFLVVLLASLIVSGVVVWLVNWGLSRKRQAQS